MITKYVSSRFDWEPPCHLRNTGDHLDLINLTILLHIWQTHHGGFISCVKWARFSMFLGTMVQNHSDCSGLWCWKVFESFAFDCVWPVAFWSTINPANLTDVPIWAFEADRVMPFMRQASNTCKTLVKGCFIILLTRRTSSTKLWMPGIPAIASFVLS